MIKLTDLLKQLLEEDRCKRIADRRYDKPSAYKSGAVVRCRKGDIWKGVKEGQYDDTSKFDLVKQNPFNIQKLVDKGIVFVGLPGDGEGGIGKHKFPGDSSIITLYNLKALPPDPWMIISVKNPRPTDIPYVQKDQYGLFYNGKYNQILWGIEKKGFKPEDFYLNIKETDNPQSGKAAPYGSGYAKVKEIIQKILKEDETLRTWFKRKGPKGKEGGWVDCNTCKDGSCKSCGRKKGEKRAKYPSCRPTPAQCKTKGKGKKWGKTK